MNRSLHESKIHKLKYIGCLNRLGFGPNLGSNPTNIKEWIETQLSFSTIKEPKIEEELKDEFLLKLTEDQLQSTREIKDLDKKIYYSWSKSKVVRALYSNKQFEEKLVDFWYNHFNVYGDKMQTRWYFGPYERDVIRKGLYGQFSDLLKSVTKSPAMLFYLDNYLNLIDKKGEFFDHKPSVENFARELLELHTVGLEANYNDADVTATAKVFSGWSIANIYSDSRFIYYAHSHDKSQKKVLGWDTEFLSGELEGDSLLSYLANHEKTNQRIVEKLVKHFVADPAPPSLIKKMQNTFRKSGGNLGELYKEMLLSTEFSEACDKPFRKKNNFEWMISFLRATGSEISGNTEQLIEEYNRFGQPLYLCAPPTGYLTESRPSSNIASSLFKFNFCEKAFANKIPGLRIAEINHKIKSKDTLSLLQETYWASNPSERAISLIQKQLSLAQNSETAALKKSLTILFSSPEFQII